ncbi:helix-turn-helix transcriptional regulator [Catenuloplanes atrovinosus]|uniref:DNA-binding CsgD family transcriptional regulator n=1 Tax=Catenuloplanes atrovinosus TaxID=137266 RepID=A0AAE4CA69_9ACTN|nr:AAA family ATPase [Catenuloplanes atrovinosus]MDR7277316.1 DNA-binding CsgD family transcriptional regulator [Catenuloplanes atrovinosus]
MTQTMRLTGRADEITAIRELLHAATGGHGGALVVRGPAGIGKTALIGAALKSHTDLRRVSTAGTGADTEPYAAVRRLCMPLLDKPTLLPEAFRGQLNMLFGTQPGTDPDPFAVGLTVQRFLVALAHTRGVVVVVEDAHALDPASAQVLAFAARRLRSSRVAMLLALRDDAAPAGSVDGGDAALIMRELPGLTLSGLADSDARSLLDTTPWAAIDPAVRERVVAEARGNPAALLTAPFDNQPGQPVTVSREPAWATRARQRYAAIAGALSTAARTVLLVAAAERFGDPLPVWRALGNLDISPPELTTAVTDAEQSGLVSIGAQVRFVHPLARSAVYHAAPPSLRREVHGRLADAVGADAGPDRASWHRSLAASGPDDRTADELEAAVETAGQRGGLPAAASFLESAALLTTDASQRAVRTLAAADTWERAGEPEHALALLGRAERAPLPEEHRTRAQSVRGRLRREPHLLLTVAATVQGASASEAVLDAHAAWVQTDGYGTPLAEHPAVAGLCRAMHARVSNRPGDLLARALIDRLAGDRETAAAELDRAAAAVREHPRTEDSRGHLLWLAAAAAAERWDDDGWRLLLDRHLTLARAGGAHASLPPALSMQALADIEAGVLHPSVEPAGPSYGEIVLAAWRGEGRRVRAIGAQLRGYGTDRAGGAFHRAADHAGAVLDNATGAYSSALDAAGRALADVPPGLTALLLPEYVEAAVYAGRPELAVAALDRHLPAADASRTAWAAGTAAACTALLAVAVEAEPLHRRAIALLDRVGLGIRHARARLRFGEWLADRGRAAEAAVELAAARDDLAAAGARAFARRAARALSRLSGGHGDNRLPDVLTRQELLVARQVAGGLTTREVAAALYVSPRTVDTHLRNVFRKLNITSRRELYGMELA